MSPARPGTPESKAGIHALWLRACCLTIIAIAATPADAHWSFDTELGVSYDNNLGNARSEDSVGDRALIASVAATQSEYLEHGDSISWGGRIAGERYADFDGLDNLALAAMISYRKKLGLGPFAPWWRASWSSSALAYRDDARNGWLHQAEVGAGKRLSERYNLGLTFRVEQRKAANLQEQGSGLSVDAFSQLSKSLGVNAEYAPDRDMVLSLGAQLRHGDIVSTSHRYRQVFLYSKAIVEDPALGSNVFAYRLTGNTLILNVAMAIFLSPDSCVNIGVQRALTHADGSNNYAKNKLAVSWVGNF
ncbi:MAG: hypothetical protein D4R84_14465 [Rhodocyclaceae bacterium]|nr:MAG: hypothetical protein D4R84_14465 [Rhodocyclaceae bacterium]